MDIQGNRCSDNCESNQIKLMPEEICITKDKCDLKFFVLNEAGTECGLCKYFYLNEKNINWLILLDALLLFQIMQNFTIKCYFY